jgi:hypothetical protein
VIIERDESDAGVFLGSVHESIAIFVFAVFFPFKSLVVDEGIVEIVLSTERTWKQCDGANSTYFV